MSAAREQPVLAVQDLRVTFPSRQGRLPVVDGVSLELRTGEIVGLVGESGCGKTMTGAALLGMVPKSSGQVSSRSMRLGETDLAQLDERGWQRIRGSRISMVFQEPLTALDPVFSVGSQLLEVIRRHRPLQRKHARTIAVDMLASVGFADRDRIMRCYPHELSGGMRQRVMIAMAMVCEPQVLVADEPTTALDVTTQAQVLHLVRNLARQSGTAVLLITHDLAIVEAVCDRAMVMYCGRISEEGPTHSLMQYPRHPYTAALLAAMPRLSPGRVEPVKGIPGSVPAPGQRPAGCSFSNRCERADELCRSQVPVLHSADPAMPAALHCHACHHPLAHPSASATA
jgi:oligopeptide/dipeptide ABC transporter ATP-binding protein